MSSKFIKSSIHQKLEPAKVSVKHESKDKKNLKEPAIFKKSSNSTEIQITKSSKIDNTTAKASTHTSKKIKIKEFAKNSNVYKSTNFKIKSKQPIETINAFETQTTSGTLKKKQFDTVKSLSKTSNLKDDETNHTFSTKIDLYKQRDSTAPIGNDEKMAHQTMKTQDRKENENSFTDIDDNYSDDFEDYISDFESDEQENDKKKDFIFELDSNLKSSNKIKPITSTWIQNFSTPKYGSFSTLLNKQKVMTRKEDLSEILSLNSVNYYIFSKPPINYEIFIHLFGRKNMKQVYIQTMPMTNQSMQTKPINKKNRAIQCPTQRSLKNKLALQIDIFKLIKFLEIAEKITTDLILEEQFQTNMLDDELTSDLKSNTSLIHQHTLKNSKNKIHQLIVNDRYLIVVQNSEQGNISSEKSLIQLLQHSSHNEPEYILINYSYITCCTADNQFKVFCGSSNGSISVWDIREPSYSFPLKSNDKFRKEREPSFSTLFTSLQHHKVSIVNIIYHHFDEDPSKKVNHQIITLDEMGLIIIWVIIELEKNDFSFLETSEGLRPGSLVKLNKLNHINLTKGQLSNDLKLPVTWFTCNFKSFFDYFIASSNGFILKHSTNQNKNNVLTKYSYYLDDCLIKIIQIQFHPKYFQIFLACYEDGSICLFNIKRETPIKIWTPKETKCRQIVSISWLSNDSLAFIYLDKLHGISMIDINLASKPIFSNQTIKDKRITSFGCISDVIGKVLIILAVEENSVYYLEFKSKFKASIESITTCVN